MIAANHGNFGRWNNIRESNKPSYECPSVLELTQIKSIQVADPDSLSLFRPTGGITGHCIARQGRLSFFVLAFLLRLSLNTQMAEETAKSMTAKNIGILVAALVIGSLIGIAIGGYKDSTATS